LLDCVGSSVLECECAGHSHASNIFLSVYKPTFPYPISHI
jgi:hypothetical protein